MASPVVSSLRKPRFVLVPIRFASEAWPRHVDCRLWKHGTSFIKRQKRKDCHYQDKQVQGASFGFVFGT